MVRLSFIWPRVRAAQLFTLSLSSLSMALHSNNYKESQVKIKAVTRIQKIRSHTKERKSKNFKTAGLSTWWDLLREVTNKFVKYMKSLVRRLRSLHGLTANNMMLDGLVEKQQEVNSKHMVVSLVLLKQKVTTPSTHYTEISGLTGFLNLVSQTIILTLQKIDIK